MSENIQKSPLPCGGGLGVGETQSIKQGYKQTSLGILPQEWEVVRLGEVGDIVGGGTPDTTNSAFWNGKIAWISSSDIDEESIYKISIRRFINEFAIKNSATNLIPAKSVLIISRVGVGKVAVNEIPLCTSQDTQSLILKNAHYIFMAYLIKHNIKTLLQYNQGTSIQGFTKTELKSLQIPLPPLAEQEKIAQILGVWDKGISVLKSLIEAKTKRKKALMQRLLTPPTHPLTPTAREGEQKSHHDTKAPPLAGGVGVGYSHIENNRNDDKVLDCHDLTASNLAMTEKNSKAKQSLRFAEFTDKWQEMRLRDILQEKSIKNTSNVNLVLSVTNKQGFVAQKDYFEQEVASNDTSNYKVIYKDEFAYNPARINVGSIAMLEKFEIGILSPMYVVFKCLEKVDNCFFRYWLESYNFTGVLHRYLSGSVRETLSFNDMKTMHIFLPTLAEQKKIAQVLSECDKEIELLKSKFQCLKTQKKGLMQRLLNGEVRVKC